jgi:quinol monooxygenase YgiN
MTTLHIENTVRDYQTWKDVFDKYDAFRAEHGVQSYRLSRFADDPNRLMIDLDFDSLPEAQAFAAALRKIWASPQSRAQLVDHTVPHVLEVIEQRSPVASVGAAAGE